MMPTTPPPAGPTTDCSTPGPRLIRRLTATQYRNTIVDIFQDPSVPETEALTDPAVHGFRVDADAPVVADLAAEMLMNYAETVAAWAVQNKKHQVANCSNHDSSCWRQVIQNFGTKIQREPLADDRVAAYEALFQAEPTFDAGLEVVIGAMLQSPYLLYRRELGQEAGGEYKLTPYELASQLSYLLTDSTPDDDLLRVAKDGTLANRDVLDQQVNRLLGSQKARGPIGNFVEGWLELSGLPEKAKDNKTFNLTESLRHAMLEETREFFMNAFASRADTNELFAANYTFVNNELAQFYGLPGVGGDGFQRVEFGGVKRAPGLLGHAAFLTAHAQPENSSPVQRGRSIRERLLCQDLPPVPENLDTNLAQPGGFRNNRERYQEHSNNVACSGCHQAMDPVGFVFEHYDGFGRYRDTEGNMPVDASGMIYGAPGGGDVPLDGVETLNAYLVSNEAVRSCLVRYWSYYAQGRADWKEKVCDHDSVRREASENGYTLQSVLTGIIHGPHFTRRVKDE